MPVSHSAVVFGLVLLWNGHRQFRGGSGKDQGIDARARRFVEYYEATVRPLEIEASRLSGSPMSPAKDADFLKKQAAEDKLDLCLSDPRWFTELKTIKSREWRNPLLARQIAVLYLEFPRPTGFRRVAPEDLGQVERGRAGVQRLPLRSRRQETDRQRPFPHPGRIARTRPSARRRVGKP